jgi:isopentenyl diphosphate isomerase/L-lactate dehydrogenase-like FMN-dependent dehydrogenase
MGLVELPDCPRTERLPQGEHVALGIRVVDSLDSLALASPSSPGHGQSIATRVLAVTEPVNIADLERLAAEKLEPGSHGYFAGGAGDERTLRRNAEAFEGWELRPRVLVDVSDVSTQATVLGAQLEMPILVGPVAFQLLAHPDGEAGMARAAEAAGTVLCLSSLTSMRPAEVAEAAPGGKRWMQVYLFRDRAVTRAMVEEAAESGYEALLLTVDAPYAGRRERDLRSGFQVPAEIRAPAIEGAVGHRSLTTAEVFELVDPSITWRDLEQLCDEYDMPILVKGLITGEDAALAVEHGAAGVVLSNHGGRQLDNAPATIDALPEVVEAVGGRIPVLLDGGVRRGTDVAVALAIGAEAVLVGRPALWGLAVDGEAGARRALEMLAAELRLALALLGAPEPSALNADHVQRRA